MSKNGWRCVDRLSRHHCFLWICHVVRLQSLLGSSQQCGRVGVSLSCLPDLTNGDVGDAAYGGGLRCSPASVLQRYRSFKTRWPLPSPSSVSCFGSLSPTVNVSFEGLRESQPRRRSSAVSSPFVVRNTVDASFVAVWIRRMLCSLWDLIRRRLLFGVLK